MSIDVSEPVNALYVLFLLMFLPSIAFGAFLLAVHLGTLLGWWQYPIHIHF